MAKIGDFSDKVATIQVKLTELGYYELDTTGIFGDYTEEAVRNFQIANGLDATGVVDAKTYEKLFSDDAVEYSFTPAVADPEPATRARIEAVTEAETEATRPEAVFEDTEPATEKETEAATEAATKAAAEPATEKAAPATTIATSPATTGAPATTAAPATQATSPAIFSITDGSNGIGLIGGTTAPTKPATTAASQASKTASGANEVTAKALEKSSNKTTDANTADVKTSANMWVWLLLVAAVLGVVAFILLMHGRKQSKAQSAKSAKANLNDRW